MKTGTIAAVVLVLLATPVHTQTRPNFSGTWVMDRARSESAVQSEPIRDLRLTITQSESELEVTSTRDGKTVTVKYSLTGEPAPIPNGTATSKWDGTTLVTEAVRTIQGQTVTTKESRRLGPTGDEMLVDTILVVQHGYTLGGAQNYGAGKDVFVRVGR